MKDKQILLVRPGDMTEADKAKLAKVGTTVVEHPTPSLAVFKSVHTDEYVFTNCSNCGERVYLLSERLAALKTGKKHSIVHMDTL